VGQRRGLAIPDATPYYVTALDPDRNQVVVGKKDTLWQSRLLVERVSWVAGRPPELPREVLTRIRYRHHEAPAILAASGAGLRVRFLAPQRAATPGQFAVFYEGDRLLGGGRITGVE